VRTKTHKKAYYDVKLEQLAAACEAAGCSNNLSLLNFHKQRISFLK